jgi:hypothetical protein
LTEWTDQAARNPFVEIGGGKALARPKELLELAEILTGLEAASVKQNTPQM